MKATTIPSQFFFKSALPADGGGFWLPAPRTAFPRTPRAGSAETDDELARKQEIVCGVILALCGLATMVLCFCQLAF